MFTEINRGGVPIKMWTRGVPIDPEAIEQVARFSRLPIIKHPVAIMPDAHVGRGAVVGSVIPTVNAIIPAAVGVDIGCGMMAQQLNVQGIDNLPRLRALIEGAVPHGRTSNGKAKSDKGAWGTTKPFSVVSRWKAELKPDFDWLIDAYPALANKNSIDHLGTLGTGNHFIEVCLDQYNTPWVMLHSGSRGIGNAIGSHFISVAKRRAETEGAVLEDKDLAWLSKDTPEFDDYARALSWAQKFARINREIMMRRVLEVMKGLFPDMTLGETAVNCHHNYVSWEIHEKELMMITRKGAVSARKDEYGIIPGSMGACSYIVKGLGNEKSYQSCSHGAGRVYSRSKMKELFTVEDAMLELEGIECRKDESIIDELPSAYKDIDLVMGAQMDLVEPVFELKQLLCVKG